MRRTRHLFVFLGWFFLLWGSGSAFAEGTEDQIKSSYIYNFLKYLQWKDHSRPAIRVGVHAPDDFMKAIKALEKKTAWGKPIEIVELKGPEDIDKSLDVVYITGEAQNWMEALYHKRLLTIGDDPRFIELGGIIRFFEKRQRIRFELHFQRALKREVVFSSKLIKVAVLVE